MSTPFKVALAGLGTVGGGTVRLLQQQAELIEKRVGRRVELVAVSALEKPPGLDLSGIRWFKDAVAMAAESDADLVIELIGGAHGVALKVCEAAINAGKHLVTANKAMLAYHGADLAALAEAKGVALGFEASVAGGIPVIKALREGLAANRISEIHGILNGTCNYILSRMHKDEMEFGAALAEAQGLGYAEADPSTDIDGIDAAHKISILASVGFGCPVRFAPANVEGIRHVSALDMKYAELLGYRIKLLGIARRSGDVLEQRVHPALVPKGAPIANVEGVFNAVTIVGDFVDKVMLVGRGAGSAPTASAVVADVIDIASGRSASPFGVKVAVLDLVEPAPLSVRHGAYYLRLMVRDQVGVLASVAKALSDSGVSIAKVFQDERSPGEKVPVVLITHESDEAAMQKALKIVGAHPALLEPPRMIRIEQF
ncbi:MAG: homoserine dehydrogenase [Rhodospirillaceae bacterium]